MHSVSTLDLSFSIYHRPFRHLTISSVSSPIVSHLGFGISHELLVPHGQTLEELTHLGCQSTTTSSDQLSEVTSSVTAGSYVVTLSIADSS